ncbi:MAG: 3-hydroxybutyrate dehydrogenase [Alphaproteobacteria bacterium]|nr:3-hydroxybutyrate dehydrogenase [Alphaproteobacteria bacterium]
MLKGKGALVTGSTSGIGLAMAKALAGEGCNIMLHGLGDPAEIERTRRALATSAAVTVGHDGADMSRPEGVAAMVAHAKEVLGTIDVLINNAGIQHVAPIDEFPLDRYDAIVAVNLSAAFHATRLVLADMKARKWGRIVNTASTHGLVASVHKGPYIMAKHGIVGLTKATALEAAPFGVTCNAICPGFTRTAMLERVMEAHAKELGLTKEQAYHAMLKEKTPTLRLVEEEEVGALALFLCGDMARSITGTAIPIDGGWTTH